MEAQFRMTMSASRVCRIVHGIMHWGFDYTTSKSQPNPGSSEGWT